MNWYMQSCYRLCSAISWRGCRWIFHILQLGLLLWLENANGQIHLHADSGPGDYREAQIPGFVKVTMSRDKGVGIGPHQFKPLHGSVSFSLLQIGERWYYEVVEQLSQRVRVSYVDAVTGVLSDPRTGKAIGWD